MTVAPARPTRQRSSRGDAPDRACGVGKLSPPQIAANRSAMPSFSKQKPRHPLRLVGADGERPACRGEAVEEGERAREEARADADIRLVVDEEVAVDRVERRLADGHALPLQRVFDQIRARRGRCRRGGSGRSRPRMPWRGSTDVERREQVRRACRRAFRRDRRRGEGATMSGDYPAGFALASRGSGPSWSSTWRMLRRGGASGDPFGRACRRA